MSRRAIRAGEPTTLLSGQAGGRARGRATWLTGRLGELVERKSELSRRADERMTSLGGSISRGMSGKRTGIFGRPYERAIVDMTVFMSRGLRGKWLPERVPTEGMRMLGMWCGEMGKWNRYREIGL